MREGKGNELVRRCTEEMRKRCRRGKASSSFFELLRGEGAGDRDVREERGGKGGLEWRIGGKG